MKHTIDRILHQIKKADTNVVFEDNSMFFLNFSLALTSTSVGITTRLVGFPINVESPIAVEKEKIKIDSEKLVVGEFYKVHYLGTELVLQKSADGEITFYEVNS